MATLFPKTLTAHQRITRLAGAILVADQLSKWIVLKLLGPNEECRVIDGFFKFVHWQNTGAAFSMFRHNNGILAVISLGALIALGSFAGISKFTGLPVKLPLDCSWAGSPETWWTVCFPNGST